MLFLKKKFCFHAKSLLLVANLWDEQMFWTDEKKIRFDLSLRLKRFVRTTPVRFDIKRNFGWAGDVSPGTPCSEDLHWLWSCANSDDFLNKDLLFSSLYILYMLIWQADWIDSSLDFRCFMFFKLHLCSENMARREKTGHSSGHQTKPCCEICPCHWLRLNFWATLESNELPASKMFYALFQGSLNYPIWSKCGGSKKQQILLVSIWGISPKSRA